MFGVTNVLASFTWKLLIFVEDEPLLADEQDGTPEEETPRFRSMTSWAFEQRIKCKSRFVWAITRMLPSWTRAQLTTLSVNKRLDKWEFNLGPAQVQE